MAATIFVYALDVSMVFMVSRALSAIAGTATIYTVYAIGRHLRTPATGLVSAASHTERAASPQLVPDQGPRLCLRGC